MGYTPFKMKGPSLYRTPVKDDGQDKARKNVELMDKESDKLKTDLSEHAKRQSLPSTKSRFFRDGEDNNIEAIIENTPKKRYTKEMKDYLRDKNKKKSKNKKSKISQEQRKINKEALETHRRRIEDSKKKKDNKGGVDRYKSVITKYDKDGQVDDRDRFMPLSPNWMK